MSREESLNTDFGVFRVVRSARKTLCLHVSRDGVVEVRVPNRCAADRIRSFVEAHRAWLEEACRRVATHREHFAVSPEQERSCRLLAAEVLPAKTAYFAARMGVSPDSVRITSAETRYGSCSAKNGICYSWRVMLLPDDLIDYIVVPLERHVSLNEECLVCVTLHLWVCCIRFVCSCCELDH